MQDFNDLYYFAKVVDHNGFAAAGRALNIPKSKLSRRVMLLEERLGVCLLQRSTRAFSVTEIGKKYYQYCNAMIVQAEAAQEFIELNHNEPCGTISLSCPPALMYFSMGKILARFMLKYPKIKVDLELTNRNVDVIGESIDVAIRVRFPPFADTDLIFKPLAQNTLCLVANPVLFDHKSLPEEPNDLLAFNTIGLGNSELESRWVLENAEGEEIRIQHQPVLVVNDVIGILDAVLLGVGIAPLPKTICHQYLVNKQLVELVPAWKPIGGTILAAFSARRSRLPAIRYLLDYLEHEYQMAIDDQVGYEKIARH